jgi:hypothetical protein
MDSVEFEAIILNITDGINALANATVELDRTTEKIHEQLIILNHYFRVLIKHQFPDADFR